MARRRSGNDSRCCDRHGAPFAWHDYVDASHPSVMAFEAWLTSLMPFARQHELGEIDDLMEAAERGELYDSGDAKTQIKPIVTDPDVYELRRVALAKQLRFYHGEPPEHPRALIKLHKHIKVASPSQQEEIEHAAARYRSGAAAGWA